MGFSGLGRGMRGGLWPLSVCWVLAFWRLQVSSKWSSRGWAASWAGSQTASLAPTFGGGKAGRDALAFAGL